MAGDSEVGCTSSCRQQRAGSRGAIVCVVVVVVVGRFDIWSGMNSSVTALAGCAGCGWWWMDGLDDGEVALQECGRLSIVN